MQSMSDSPIPAPQEKQVDRIRESLVRLLRLLAKSVAHDLRSRDEPSEPNLSTRAKPVKESLANANHRVRRKLRHWR